MRPTLVESGPTEYDAFAPYYDAFTAASDYERWTAQVLELAGRHAAAAETLLDLACGTGNSFLPFLRRGLRVTGCDSSRAMLAEAARKAPEATLVHADIRDVTMLGRFDLVTCFDDSLNYLLDADDLAAALASIVVNLARGGLAIFDVNTLLAYRTTFATDSVSVREGTVFAWRGECPAGVLRGGSDRRLRPARRWALCARRDAPRAAALPARAGGRAAGAGRARVPGRLRGPRRRARRTRGRAEPAEASVHRDTRERRCCPVTIKKTDKPALPALSITKIS